MNPSDAIPRLPGHSDLRVFAPGASRTQLETEILPAYIAQRRWFGGKARRPRHFRLRDIVPLGAPSKAALFTLVEIEYEEGAPDTYLLPLHFVTGGAAETLLRAEPGAVLARFEDGVLLADALHDETFRQTLFELMATRGNFAGEHGRVAGLPGDLLDTYHTVPPSRVLGVEQSNSSIIYGESVFLKLYRRLESGVNPDAEILRFLGTRHFSHVPPFGGDIEYRSAHDGTSVLGLALGLVPNDGDAWSFTLRHLASYYDRILRGDTTGAAQLEVEYLESATQLGTRTGELHLALASESTDPGFTPEPFTAADGATLATTLRESIRHIHGLMAERLAILDSDTLLLAHQFQDAVVALQAGADAPAHLVTSAVKTRTHGDYHLGQVLHGPGGFVIIDFEGEPLRPLAERRRKMSPFRDVAGMLRSFHYAAHAALEPLGEHRATLTATAEAWAYRVQETFLTAWRGTTEGANFRDPTPAHEATLLDAHLLEKALYEVRYEVNNRPTWLGIPLRGILALLRNTA